MSRSDYSEEIEDWWTHIRWRGAVRSALRGKRGQAFLREMLVAFDKLENKRLIAGSLTKEGEVCAIGSVGAARGLDMSRLDPENYDAVAGAFGIATALAREIVWLNDEGGSLRETPEQRYLRMRRRIESELSEDPAP